MIAILGAGGRLGRFLVAEALGRGELVRALVHTSNPLAAHPGLDTRSVDVRDLASLRQGIEGVEGVISALGSASASPPDVQERGAAHLVAVMRDLGLSRLVSVTGSGARLPDEALSPEHEGKRVRMLAAAPHLLADGDRHLAVIAASELNWTVVRVPFMTAQLQPVSYVLHRRAPRADATLPYRSAASAMSDLVRSDEWAGAAPFVSARRADSR